jgi:autotransporter-associated beta strand protein
VSTGASDNTIGGLSGAGSNTITSIRDALHVEAGSGSITTLGMNLYSQATNIVSGAVQLGASNAIPATSAVTVAVGAILDLDGFDDAIASLAGTGAVELGSAILTTGSDNTSTSFDGVISGAGSLVKTGTGTLILSGMSTFTGATTILAGILMQGAANALPGSSAVTVSAGAILDLNSFDNAVGSLAGAGSVVLESATLITGSDNTSTSFAGIISGTGSLVKTGTSTFTLSGINTYTGATTIIAGILTLGATNALPGSSVVIVVAGATLALNNSNDNTSTSFAGTVSGAGGLAKIGSGTIILSGISTYTGATMVSAGVLRLGATSAVPASSSVTVAAGATFDLNNSSLAIGSLAGAGAVTLGSGTLTTGGDDTSTAFSGILSGTGRLIKTGTGTLTLSGENTYNGPTLVTAGTLLVNGSQPTSDVTVSNGAALGGAGAVGKIMANGAVSPGGPGTAVLQTDETAFNAGSSLVVKLNGTTPGSGYDQLNAVGPVALTADAVLATTAGFQSSSGDSFTILQSSSRITGTFRGLADNSTLTISGQLFRIHYTPNSVILTRLVLPTTTVLISSFNPSSFGQPVSFTATVTALASAAAFPTGTVTFKDGTTPLGTATLDPSGNAALSIATLPAGPHLITAVYDGDVNFTASTSAALNQVVVAATTKTVFSPANASVFGQPVILTAQVTVVSPGAGRPGGTVTFREGAITLGTGSLDGQGIATFTTSTLTVGTHVLTAIYSGESNFTASTSLPLNQMVNQAATTVLLSSIALGQAITFTATVTAAAPGSGNPTGTVTFQDGSTMLGTSRLADRVATFTTSSLTGGTHRITASYNSDPNFIGSTSAPLEQTIAVVLPSQTSPDTSSSSPRTDPQLSGTSNAPQPKPSVTTSVGVGVFGLSGGVVGLLSGVSVTGPVTPSSGTSVISDTTRQAGSRPLASTAGPASGSDDIAGQRPVIRSGDLASSGFEPGLPSSNAGFQPGLPSSSDITLGPIDIARFLLTGVRPSASLLLQQGSTIAPVATVTTGRAEEDSENSQDPAPEEKSIWPNYVIGLHDTFNRSPVEALDRLPGVSRTPETPARGLAVMAAPESAANGKEARSKLRLREIKIRRVEPDPVDGRSRHKRTAVPAEAWALNVLNPKTDRIGPECDIPLPKGSPAHILEAAPLRTGAVSTIARATVFLAGLLLSWPRRIQARTCKARMHELAARGSVTSCLTGE